MTESSYNMVSTRRQSDGENSSNSDTIAAPTEITTTSSTTSTGTPDPFSIAARLVHSSPSPVIHPVFVSMSSAPPNSQHQVFVPPSSLPTNDPASLTANLNASLQSGYAELQGIISRPVSDWDTSRIQVLQGHISAIETMLSSTSPAHSLETTPHQPPSEIHYLLPRWADYPQFYSEPQDFLRLFESTMKEFSIPPSQYRHWLVASFRYREYELYEIAPEHLDWPTIRSRFIDHYQSPFYAQEKLKQLLALRFRPSDRLELFVRKFCNLARRANLHQSSWHTVLCLALPKSLQLRLGDRIQEILRRYMVDTVQCASPVGSSPAPGRRVLDVSIFSPSMFP